MNRLIIDLKCLNWQCNLEMKITYLITSYKLPEQLVRLVQQLNTDETSFFIHVDQKADHKIHKFIAEQLGAFRNVHLVKPIRCNWGEFDQVRIVLNGIQEIVESRHEYDYIIQLTGQCYPIKSNQHIQEFLKSHSGYSFLNYFTSPDPLAEKWEERFSYWHIIYRKWHFTFPRKDMFASPGLNNLWNFLANHLKFRRKIPGGMKSFFGGSHWCLSRDCVEYLYEFTLRNPKYVKFFSKFVQFPSEIFYQTILLNSPLKGTIINDDLFFIDFNNHKAHPVILKKDDFQRFMNTGNLFARKFDSSIDAEVLDLIDNAI